MRRAAKRGLLAGSMTALGLWLGFATASLAHQPSGPTQAGIQLIMIDARLQSDPSLKNEHIDVTIDDGVARLTGTVDSPAQKAAAARDAEVAGIVGVDNQLVVAAPAANRPSPPTP